MPKREGVEAIGLFKVKAGLARWLRKQAVDERCHQYQLVEEALEDLKRKRKLEREQRKRSEAP